MLQRSKHLLHFVDADEIHGLSAVPIVYPARLAVTPVSTRHIMASVLCQALSDLRSRLARRNDDMSC